MNSYAMDPMGSGGFGGMDGNMTNTSAPGSASKNEKKVC